MGWSSFAGFGPSTSYDGVLLMMVTTETEMENVVRALAAGANEYVMKPFTQEVILEKLQIFGMARFLADALRSESCG